MKIPINKIFSQKNEKKLWDQGKPDTYTELYI